MHSLKTTIPLLLLSLFILQLTEQADLLQAQQVIQPQIHSNTKLINTDAAAIATKQMQLEQMTLTPTNQGYVLGCYVKQQAANKIHLSVPYTMSSKSKTPVYVGAWVYQSREGKADVGYMPAQLPEAANGKAELTLVVNKTPFWATHIEVFLIQDGKEFGTGSFKFPFIWSGDSGFFRISDQAVPTDNGQADTTFRDDDIKKLFCTTYADAAIEQYNLGRKYNLRGIVPPVWSNDHNAHYNWCLTADEQTVKNGDMMRSQHLQDGLPKFVLDDMRSRGQQVPGLDPGRGP